MHGTGRRRAGHDTDVYPPDVTAPRGLPLFSCPVAGLLPNGKLLMNLTKQRRGMLEEIAYI